MKPIPTIQIILINILVIISCSEEEDLPKYYLNNQNYVSPLAPGHFSEYNLTGKSGATNFSGSLKQNCSETNVRNPFFENSNLIVLNQYLTLDIGDERGVTNTSTYYEVRSDGIYLHGGTSGDNELYWVNEGTPLKLNFNYYVGATISISYSQDEMVNYSWLDEPSWSNLDQVTENYTVIGIEFAQCELGDFECYKLFASSRNNSSNSEETRWVYPGVGAIKREVIITKSNMTAEYNFELVSTNAQFN